MTINRSSAAVMSRLLVVTMGMLVLASCSGGSSSTSTSTGTSTSTTPASNNSVTLTAGFGPNGQAGGYLNGLFTTVTICAPGSTTTCQTINNILVDTGSVGLRIISGVLTIPQTSLGTIQDSSSDQLQECIQYGDTSYSWGPMWAADVEIAGEKAPGVPIQVVGGNASNATFAAAPSQCLATPPTNVPNGGNEDTVATFGANGILGVGTYAQDCGSGCVQGNLTQTGYPYYVCPSGQACQAVNVPLAVQAVNPVAYFSSSDNNGVVINLPNVSSTAGAASVTGTMWFGIGTQSDNALGSATVYALNNYEIIPTVTYNGVAYTTTNLFDTGSNSLALSDHATLGIADCSNSTFYCPSSTITLSGIQLAGYDSIGTGTVSVNIANTEQLVTNNPNSAVFNDVGGDGGTSPSNDLMDFGLPFFLGNTIFVGIGGQPLPSGVNSNAAYGYFAF